MKCLSRSTLGVIVGVLHALAYACVSVYIIINLIKVNTKEIDKTATNDDNAQVNTRTGDRCKNFNRVITDFSKNFAILIGSLMMTVLSILLIIGIVKRRHLLMLPWLGIASFSFVWSTIQFAAVSFVGSLIGGANLSMVIFILLFGITLIGLSGLIIYKIYTLYRDIRIKNKERSREIVIGRQIGLTNAYTEPPTYSALVAEKA